MEPGTETHKSMNTLCIRGETFIYVPRCSNPSMSCQKMHDRKDRAQHKVKVIFKCAHAELMLHLFNALCVSKAHSAPGPWTQGHGTTGASSGSVLMRPVSLLMRFLARHLQSFWWWGVDGRTTACQQLRKTGVCFSLLLWQDNDRFKLLGFNVSPLPSPLCDLVRTRKPIPELLQYHNGCIQQDCYLQLGNTQYFLCTNMDYCSLFSFLKVNVFACVCGWGGL